MICTSDKHSDSPVGSSQWRLHCVILQPDGFLPLPGQQDHPSRRVRTLLLRVLERGAPTWRAILRRFIRGKSHLKKSPHTEKYIFIQDLPSWLMSIKLLHIFLCLSFLIKQRFNLILPTCRTFCPRGASFRLWRRRRRVCPRCSRKRRPGWRGRRGGGHGNCNYGRINHSNYLYV